MARISSVVVSLAALAALIVATIVTLRVGVAGWRHVLSSIFRAFRPCQDHPKWEVLMQ